MQQPLTAGLAKTKADISKKSPDFYLSYCSLLKKLVFLEGLEDIITNTTAS